MLAAPGREAALASGGWPVELPGADATEAIASLAGAGWCEQARGGVAVAILSAAELADGSAMPAALAASRLGVAAILGVVGLDDVVRRLFTAAGWSCADDGDVISGPTVVGIDDGPAGPIPMAGHGRWQPVHLYAVRDWSRETGDVLASLPSLVAREPHVILADSQRPWCDLSGPALPMVLGALAGEGKRVCWRVPAATDLRACVPGLRRLADRGRAMTLIVDDFTTDSLAFWHALPGWWVMAAADDGEFRALLARALRSEDLCVVARPPTGAIETWPSGDAHVPGTGRWLASEPAAKATLVCASAGSEACQRAREALTAMGIAVGIYHVSSVIPLPEAELAEASSRGPLIVADDGEPSAGLAGAITRCGLPARAVGGRPLAADLAAAVRDVLR